MFRIKATPTLVNSFMAKYNRVPRHRHDYEYLNCHNITLYGMNDNEEPSVLVVSKLIRNTSGILHVISQYLLHKIRAFLIHRRNYTKLNNTLTKLT